MRDHPIFKCGSNTSVGVIALITALLSITDETFFADFCKSSVLAMWVVLTSCEGKVLKPEAYDGMWRNFHVFRNKPCAEWERLISSLGIQSGHS